MPTGRTAVLNFNVFSQGFGFALLLFSSTEPTPAPRVKPPLGLSARFTVTEVIDGDTLKGFVVVPLTVRLVDCWAPELRPRKEVNGVTRNDREVALEKNNGYASKRNLERLTQNKTGVLNIDWGEARGLANVLSFGRVLGWLWIDGSKISVNELQVRQKHATQTKGGR